MITRATPPAPNKRFAAPSSGGLLKREGQPEADAMLARAAQFDPDFAKRRDEHLPYG